MASESSGLADTGLATLSVRELCDWVATCLPKPRGPTRPVHPQRDGAFHRDVVEPRGRVAQSDL